MALSVVVDYNSMVVYLSCSDIVAAQELMDYEREKVGEDYQGYHCFADFRECLLDVEYSELLVLAVHAGSAATSPNCGARTAILVADRMQAEMMEFYREAHHEVCDPQVREIAIFRDMEVANAWVMDRSPVQLSLVPMLAKGLAQNQ